MEIYNIKGKRKESYHSWVISPQELCINDKSNCARDMPWPQNYKRYKTK